MAGSILTAELQITGQDKTGAAFAGVIAHARELQRTLAGMRGLGLNDPKLAAANAELRKGTAALSAQNAAWRQINTSVSLGNAQIEQRMTLMTRLGQRWGGFMRNIGYIAGPAVLMGTRRAIRSGAEIQSEKVKMQAAGIPDAEIESMSRRGGELSALYPNVGLAEVLERYKELRSVLAHREETPHLIGSAIQAASALKALGLSTEGLPFAYKTAEVQGLAQDPERFKNFLDSYVKATQVMGKTITPESMLRGAQMLKASSALLSDRFKNTTYLSMLQDMGTRAGAGVNAAIAEVIGNFQGQHSAAKQFVALGLAREEDFDKTKTGEIMGLKAGRHIQDWQMASRDLDQYVWQKLLPALQAHGFNTQEQQIAEVMRLFPYKRASDVIAKLIQQQPSFEQHAKLYGAARGLGATDLIGHDPLAALGELSTALSNFAGVAASAPMQRAASIMNELAHGIGGWSVGLAAWQKRHPQLAEAGASGAILGGTYFGLTRTWGLLFGSGTALRGSAVALSGSAAALDAAAARLAGGGVAGAAASGLAGGGAGVAGLAATFKSGGTVAAAIGALQAMNVDAHSGNRLRSSLRELFGIADPKEPAPWMPGGAWHPRAADELTPANRRRFTLDDIHDAIHGGEAPKAELTGNAQIDTHVRVDPSPDFITRIETMISNAIHAVTINGTPAHGSSGSTGPAMREALPAGP